MTDKPKIIKRDGVHVLRCVCKRYTPLGVYAMAHTHVVLFRECQCGRRLKLFNMAVSVVT